MAGFDDPFLSDVLQPQEPVQQASDADGGARVFAEGSFVKSPPGAAVPHSPFGIRRPVTKSPFVGMAAPPALGAKSITSTPGAVDDSDGAPFEGLTATFAAADPMSAGEFLCLIPADVGSGGGLSLESEMKGNLRAEIRQWIDGLRKRNTTAAGQLRSLSPRDEAIDRLAAQMVEQASKSRTGVWTAALPTGRQLALVRADVLKTIGLDQLVRFIHHQAIKVAMANGDPYSQAALQVYEGAHPEMSASGAG